MSEIPHCRRLRRSQEQTHMNLRFLAYLPGLQKFLRHFHWFVDVPEVGPTPVTVNVNNLFNGTPGPAILQTLTKPGRERFLKLMITSSASSPSKTRTVTKPPPGFEKVLPLPLMPCPRTSVPTSRSAEIVSTLSRNDPF